MFKTTASAALIRAAKKAAPEMFVRQATEWPGFANWVLAQLERSATAEQFAANVAETSATIKQRRALRKGYRMAVAEHATNVAQFRAAAALRRVEEEVQQGLHDSTQGLRPTSVFRDQEGAICVSYPSGPGWIAWERKVSY